MNHQINGMTVVFNTVIKNGSTSEVMKCSKNKFVKKKVTEYLNYNVYEREIHILNLLKHHNFDWCPTLIETNDNEKSFIMTYCGEIMNKNNRPENYKEQIQSIVNDMKSINMKHNDIKEEEILVLGSKIYITDFGWVSINNDFSCGVHAISCKKKPGTPYDDNRIFSF